jgi:uncharacterized protein
MPAIASSAQDMIGGMTPSRIPGAFVFVSIAETADAGALTDAAIASFREAEGLSLVVPFDVAQGQGLANLLPMVCITLNVYSSLEGVGLTAAVAQALAEEGIACNMIAAYHHDHVFVPVGDGDRAMVVLQRLQGSARNSG